MSAGYSHSLGVRSNGTAWGWGGGTVGQTGIGITGVVSSPVSVVGGFTDWIQVSGGQAHSLGVRANGTAWAWGLAYDGRLGNNSATGFPNSPVLVVGGFTDWVQVSAGNQHSLGVRSNGTAWGWGSNQKGQLGDSTTTQRNSPVSVVGGYTDWVQVSVSQERSHGIIAGPWSE